MLANQIKYVILHLTQFIIEYNMANLHCIKAVLAEKGIMSKWLAKTLQKDPATVSKWCNNHAPVSYTHQMCIRDRHLGTETSYITGHLT